MRQKRHIVAVDGALAGAAGSDVLLEFPEPRFDHRSTVDALPLSLGGAEFTETGDTSGIASGSVVKGPQRVAHRSLLLDAPHHPVDVVRAGVVLEEAQHKVAVIRLLGQGPAGWSPATLPLISRSRTRHRGVGSVVLVLWVCETQQKVFMPRFLAAGMRRANTSNLPTRGWAPAQSRASRRCLCSTAGASWWSFHPDTGLVGPAGVIQGLDEQGVDACLVL